MNDNQNEGNSQPAGGSEQPTSTPSGQESQPLPGYVTDLRNQIAQLQTELRGQQKGADKRFEQMQGNIRRVLELGGQGLNESQIERELFVDDLMKSQNRQQEQSAPVQPPAGSGSANTGFDVESVLESLAFAPNDPSLAILKKALKDNPQALIVAANQLRVQQLTSPNPSGATGLSPQGEVNQEPLQQEYERRRNEIAAQSHGDAKLRALAELRVQMRQKGLASV